MDLSTAISCLMNNDRNAFWYECTSIKELEFCLYYAIQDSKNDHEYNDFLKKIYQSIGGNNL